MTGVSIFEKVLCIVMAAVCWIVFIVIILSIIPQSYMWLEEHVLKRTKSNIS